MKLSIFTQTMIQGDVQEIEHEGRRHWILPVIMMVEGVHSGSGGPLLYTAAELSKFTEAWDGSPVVVNHPAGENDEPISANSPEGNSQIIGRLFHTHMEGLKLKSEAWVDIEKLQKISPETYQQIQDQRALDVSVGVYSEELDKQGTFNNEEYRAVAQHLRPDHLALLPGAMGACSWDDGCGVRVNHKVKANEVKNLKTLSSKELLKQGVGTQMISNEVGFREIMQNVQQKLDQLDNDIRIHFLEDLFDNDFVYRVHNRETGDTAYYKRNYTVQEDGSIDFSTDPVQVRKDTSFIEMESGKLKRTNFSNNHKTKKMEKSKCCPDKVDALIANKASRFTEKDKEWLSALEETQLESMFPMETKKPEVTSNKEAKDDATKKPEVVKEDGPVKINREELTKTVKAIFNESKDPNEFIDNFMPEGMKGQMKSGLKMYHEKREQLIEGIVKNSKFEAEALKTWEDNDLQSLHDSVVPETDYSVQGLSSFSANGSSSKDNGMGDMLGLPKEDKQ